MNSDRWDGIGRSWIDGSLYPANGMEEWLRIAEEEADVIAALLPDGARALCEVGCGVGRLTRWLSGSLPFVYATDTSEVMRTITEMVTSGQANVCVVSPGREPPCDVALVWKLYDDEWSDEAAVMHIDSLLEWHTMALVETDRPYLAGYFLGRTVQAGAGWMLLHTDAGPPGS